MSNFEIIKYLLSSLLPRKYFSGDRFDYRFKKLVRQRYGNRCAITGSDKYLVVHHYYGVATNKYLRASPKNGVLITAEIHKKFHVDYMGGWAVPCARQDFIKFMNKEKMSFRKL